VTQDVASDARPAGIISKTARRIAVALTISIAVGLLLLTHLRSSPSLLLLRSSILGLSATAAFALLQVWPRRLPSWFQRWVLQVAGVALSVPITASALYLPSRPGAPPFFEDFSWVLLAFAAMLVGPWTALAAIVRQKEAFARHQKLAFALERTELERQTLDARLHLLQAQVAPHFLFNTLANVRALVDAGSPHASRVLGSLIQYLRATVPLLHEQAATIEGELQLVRPYLELMQMRMPDRLQYALDVDPAALPVRCPPTTVLTLVENAVRHGIDPSEEGGRIEIDVHRVGDRCLVRVSDTGVGIGESASGLGTGLTTLRERLQLIFGDAAELRLLPNRPRGAAVEVDMPART
jgi:signal transduction histidine kinase